MLTLIRLNGGSQRQRINIVEEWIAKSIHRIQHRVKITCTIIEKIFMLRLARVRSQVISVQSQNCCKGHHCEAASLPKQQTS